MPNEPLSGTQFTLRAGGYVAEIAAIGASLRSLRFRGRDLVVPYDASEPRPAMRGAILAPWPNRTAGGRYRFDDRAHQLAVNELETNNASHGLIAWQRFEPRDHAGDRVRLRGWIEAQPGYPWRVRLDVEYALDGDGLGLTVQATNESPTGAPFGIGIHPYLLAGSPHEATVNEWMLTSPADQVLLTDARMLPTELVEVADHEDGAFDFRQGRRIGSAVLNHAFTGLTRDADGSTRVQLSSGNGIGTEIAWDEACPWLQLYTADEATGNDRRHAVAVEPQSCPPDALNSGRDLMRLEPDENARFAWRIRALDE